MTQIIIMNNNGIKVYKFKSNYIFTIFFVIVIIKMYESFITSLQLMDQNIRKNNMVIK